MTSLGPDPERDSEAILEAAARLWTAGVPVDWLGLRGGTAGRRVPLPTYPFERKRCWIEPLPIAEPAGEGVSRAGVPPGAAAGEPAPGGELAAPRPRGRSEVGVAAQLRAMLAGLSGMPEEEIEPARPLLEMGFDSLPLVQLSANIERSFGVKVTFGQILEDMPTLQQLAAHLQAVLGLSPAPRMADLDAPRAGVDLPGGLPRIETGTAASALSGTLDAKHAADLLRALPELSDAEVTAMLTQVVDDDSEEEGQE